MKIYDEKEIRNVIIGSGYLSGGGGGSTAIGVKLFNKYLRGHGGRARLKVYSVSEMQWEDYGIVVAGMGKPSAVKYTEIEKVLKRAYQRIKVLTETMGVPAAYVYPIEMGGANTFFPLLTALNDHDVHVVDVDAAGRAVPGLDTLLIHVNGGFTAPLVVASEKDYVDIILGDRKDAVKAEKIAGGAVACFSGIAGVAGWRMNREELGRGLPHGSIEYALMAGRCVERVTHWIDAIEKIGEIKRRKTRTFVMGGRITSFKKAEPINGRWDAGYYEVADGKSGTKFRVMYINENLAVYDVVSGYNPERPVVTAPDIICLYDQNSYKPLSNDDLESMGSGIYQITVTLGVIAVDEKWWLNYTEANRVWKNYFSMIKYHGNIVRI